METYKTDIEWFKELPVGWSSFRFVDYIDLKHGFQFRDFDFTDEGIKIVKITQLNQDGSLDLSDCSFIEAKRLDEFNDILIKEGDILMALTGGTIGKIIRCAEIKEPLLQNYRVGNFIPFRGLDKGFLFYLLSSQLTLDQIDYYINRNGQPNIGKENFKRMFFPFPPNPEQTAIANYLDRKTSTIDKKTELLNQKIETYKKLRKAIINKAVTKGLDNKVALKESDLGFSVPVHWKKVRLKDIGNLYSGLSGKSGDDFNQEDNLNNKSFIPFTNIANNTYLDKEHLGTVVVGENENQNAVKKGDIFFLMSSEGYDDIGKTAVLVDDLKETYLNSFCKGFRINKTKTNSNFLNYALLSDFYRKRMIVEGKGFTRINLKMEKVSNFEMNLPTDVKEQHQIAEYLDQKTATIDKIVANLQTQITTLQHLRKVLINDAVTGKIKVV